MRRCTGSLEHSWRCCCREPCALGIVPGSDCSCVHVTLLSSRKTIFPPAHQVYSAFKLTPLPAVKVVILGQDPYHGPAQAHGLAFSVCEGVPAPPSLKNIFKELEDDVGIRKPTHGNLEHWAKQGVFMLNTVLTVEKACANSHQKRGWEEFTGAVIRALANQKRPIVFMLWGKPAQTAARCVEKSKHCVLEAVHPSPLSGASLRHMTNGSTSKSLLSFPCYSPQVSDYSLF